MKEGGNFPRVVKIRFPDGETETGYMYEPVVLIHPNIAVYSKTDTVEIYRLKQVECGEVYDLVSMLDPLEIRNRNKLNLDEFVKDASNLSFGEFWDRYIEVF